MSSKATKLVLKKNKKLDKIYHQDTGLVFKSATEKVVIGRIVDDEFISLDEEALELCEQHNFKYDESLVETEEAEEQENTSETETDSSKEVVKETPKEVVKETPKEVVKETPKEVVKETPKEVVKETPKEVVKETPKEVVKETPKEVVKETPKEVVKETPKEVGNFSTILSRYNKELNEYVSSQQADLQMAHDRVSELEKQLAFSRKEVEDVKKKLRGVLSAMQGEL